MYKLDLAKHESVWDNFVTYLESCKVKWVKSVVDVGLVPFNGRDVPNTSLIEFETEEDAVAFVLRLS